MYSRFTGCKLKNMEKKGLSMLLEKMKEKGQVSSQSPLTVMYR